MPFPKFILPPGFRKRLEAVNKRHCEQTSKNKRICADKRGYGDYSLEECVAVSNHATGVGDLILGARHDVLGGIFGEGNDDALLDVNGDDTLSDSESCDDGGEETHDG